MTSRELPDLGIFETFHVLWVYRWTTPFMTTILLDQVGVAEQCKASYELSSQIIIPY